MPVRLMLLGVASHLSAFWQIETQVREIGSKDYEGRGRIEMGGGTYLQCGRECADGCFELPRNGSGQLRVRKSRSPRLEYGSYSPVGVFSIFRKVRRPSTTLPNTVCLPSKTWYSRGPIAESKSAFAKEARSVQDR